MDYESQEHYGHEMGMQAEAELEAAANAAEGEAQAMQDQRPTKSRLIEICEEISKDAKNDATEFDGKPFTGKNVATYFGYHGASIATLADILKQIIEDKYQE